MGVDTFSQHPQAQTADHMEKVWDAVFKELGVDPSEDVKVRQPHQPARLSLLPLMRCRCARRAKTRRQMRSAVGLC